MQHGFTFPERWCHDWAAGERIWKRVFVLFRRNLSGDRDRPR
jgi:carboxymethylenebutenolidase